MPNIVFSAFIIFFSAVLLFESFTPLDFDFPVFPCRRRLIIGYEMIFTWRLFHMGFFPVLSWHGIISYIFSTYACCVRVSLCFSFNFRAFPCRCHSTFDTISKKHRPPFSRQGRRRSSRRPVMIAQRSPSRRGLLFALTWTSVER